MQLKITISLLFALLFLFPNMSTGQKTLNKFIEIHTNLGFSNDLAPPNFYSSFSLGENILIEEKSYVFARSVGLSIGMFMSKNFGLKVSFGQLQHGFEYRGITAVTSTEITSSYKITYLDFCAGVLFRKQLTPDVKFMSSLDLNIHTDPSPKSEFINIRAVNASSISGFAGLEIPMFGDHFFTNFGIIVSYPLTQYNASLILENEYLPYFLGLKIGVNYQF